MTKEQIESILILSGILAFVESKDDFYKAIVKVLGKEGIKLVQALVEEADKVDAWAVDNKEQYCEMIASLIKEQAEKTKCILSSTQN
jgi:ABC-type nitrate/sulfonate/bicarbonate transport system substrate-binding protein